MAGTPLRGAVADLGAVARDRLPAQKTEAMLMGVEPRPRGRRPVPARRDAVLDAAKQAFFERGFEAAGVRDIAGRLGFTSGPSTTTSVDGFVRLIGQARREGAVRKELDPELMTLLIIGSLNSIVRWVRHSAPRSPEQLADVFVDVLVRGIAAEPDGV